MPPRKQRRMRVKAREYGEQQLEALGFPARMEFELDDGSIVELVHPWLWSDGVQEAFDGAKTSVEIARAILGEEEHARFIAGGGKSNQIPLAIELMRQRHAETASAETDPKGK